MHLDNFTRQREREETLATVAYERAVYQFAQTSNSGHASSLPSAAWIVGKYINIAVKGLEVIDQAPQTLSVINDLGRQVVIGIAIEACLDCLMSASRYTRTYVMSVIAERLDREAIVGSFTKVNPLRAAILHKRATKECAGQAKKARMFLTSSESTGDPVLRISRELGIQIGAIAIGCLQGAGMLDEHTSHRGGKPITHLSLSEECNRELVDRINYDTASYGISAPMLCPPDDWDERLAGGYLTPGFKEVHRLVLGPASYLKAFRGVPLPRVYGAINALQKTPWRVCKRVLEVVQSLAGTGRLKEIIPEVQVQIPEYPEHLQGIKKEDRTPEQEDEHNVWLAAARDAWSMKHKEQSAAVRFIRVLEDARGLKDEERFYFVYAFDSRGRIYPRFYGMSPQGSDLQKALLEFADGAPIPDDTALVLFKNNLAHRWGFDKASYADTMEWFAENEEQILLHAEDPLTYDEWMKCDSPLMYLQAAMEYREYLKDPKGFLSHIPIAADGSCSGSQHMAAIMRDLGAAEATNLCKRPTRHDLYKMVGECSERKIKALSASGELPGVLVPFLEHGIPRAMVKRPTMTLPYGLQKISVSKYLVTDYLAFTPVEGLDPKQVWLAGSLLGGVVWSALEDTLTSTVKMLQWLRTAVREALQSRDTLGIQWTTPDGFPAQQMYRAREDLRIRVYCGKPISILVEVPSRSPDKRHHAQAFAPNFIHSMDANHLRSVVVNLHEKGCRHFAMIHDDFGCRIDHAVDLWKVVREEFVKQYQDHDVMGNLIQEWGLELAPVPLGMFNLEEVLEAEFAFK